MISNDDHPLTQELVSLRQAVTHYQLEAHNSSVKLQRHSLDASNALSRLQSLQDENSRLKEEITAFRSHPDVTPSSSSIHIQELTLALRRLSDKLDSTEATLLRRNEDINSVILERDRAKSAAENAFAIAARLRGEVERGKESERGIMAGMLAAEESRRMSDLALQEYASLVRSLENRNPQTHSNGITSPDRHSREHSNVEGLAAAKMGLQRLLEESNATSEKSQSEINQLQGMLDVSEASLAAERQASINLKRKLAQTELELQRIRTDDNAAAKMVARYMKFSQSSTDVLHTAMENLKMRHIATLASFQERLHQAEDRLATELRQSERLRKALDDLTEDISREAYGRRREIGLRLALLGREERMADRLRRWLSKSDTVFRKTISSCGSCSALVGSILQNAQSILERLDGAEAAGKNIDGAYARVLAAQNAVNALTTELQKETDKRLQLERQFALHPPSQIADQFDLKRSIKFNSISNSSSEVLSPVISKANKYRNPLPLPSYPTSAEVPAVVSSLSLPSTADDGQYPEAHADEGVAIIPSLIVSDSSTVAVLRDRDLDTDSAISAKEAIISEDEPKDRNGTSERSIIPSPPHGIHMIETDSNATQTDAACEISEIDCTDSLIAVTSDEVTGAAHVPEQERHAGIFIDSNPEGRESQPCPEQGFCPSTLPGQTHPGNGRSDTTVQNVPFPTCDDDIVANNRVIEAYEPLQPTPSHMDPILESLLVRLQTVSTRYDIFQRSFRDCHLSLKQVEETVESDERSIVRTRTLETAIERLDDYCEDARVELEIRVADEERLAKGYEALLSVPGALSDEIDDGEVMRQIEAFIDGSDHAVRKSLDLMQHKLDDLQHDIARIKQVMHEVDLPASPGLPATEGTSKPASPLAWATWTSSILSSSRPSSPAPTFGSVVTSPHLRHSSSFHRSASDSSNQDPFATMGLRIAMPSRNSALPSNNLNSPIRPPPRPRVSSALFSIGIGGIGSALPSSRRSSLALPSSGESTAKPYVRIDRSSATNISFEDDID